jgi:hypothetical protein
MKGPPDGRSSFANGVLNPKSTAAPRSLATPRGRAGADMPGKATPRRRVRRGVWSPAWQGLAGSLPYRAAQDGEASGGVRSLARA